MPIGPVPAVVVGTPVRRALVHQMLHRHVVRVVAAVPTVGAATAAAPSARMVLLDLEGLGRPAHQVKVLREQMPNALVCCTHPSCDIDLAVDVLEAGARGYVSTDGGTQHVRRAVGAVLGGQWAIPRSVAGSLAQKLHHLPRPHATVDPMHRLAQREREVVRLLARGLSTRQISDRLTVEPVTVRAYISAACTKLGVRGRSELLDAVRDPDAPV